MNKDETSDAAAPPGNGFRISDQPVVGEERAASPRNGQSPARGSSDDLVYVVARDPKSLFLYWDLNWTRLFARAGISARQVHLRTYRGDGSVERTQEINPFRGHCYAEVGAAGTEYYCEVGSFDGTAWTGLARSGRTATPEASMADDFSAEFATLPLHLSFQKLLDILVGSDLDRTTLANSIAELQENARINGGETNDAELSTLLESGRPAETPTAEELARWKELGERYGGSSWSGASKSGFGGSSPA